MFRIAYLVPVFLFLSACSSKQEPAHVHHAQIFSMGTTIDISLYGISEEKKHQVMSTIVDDFSYMNMAWHPWRDGTLGRVNHLLEMEGEFHTSVSIIRLIDSARPLYEQSGGLFNPALGRLVRLWGFHQDDLPDKPPAKEEIAKLVTANPGMNDLTIKGTAIRNTNAAVALDFGGYAKGYGVDRVIDHLRELGIENAIINAGGDLHAIGQKGDKPWRIAIKHPRGSGILAAINLAGDESLVTSGDYERYFEYQGNRYHHILDPRTGFPAGFEKGGLQSVTVLHQSAAKADAVATAIMVAGLSDWTKLASNMGASHVMLVSSEGTVYMTPEMSQRIEFKVNPAPKTLVVKFEK